MSATEAAAAKAPLGAALAEGVSTLSLDQTVRFTRYIRCVLPLDGFIFWLKADLLSPSALLNALGMNRTPLNTGPVVVQPAATIDVAGSLHYASMQRQDEAESFSQHKITFTSLSEVQDFKAINPAELWLGEFEEMRFAFSQQRDFYRQADLYHYTGDAVYPALSTQIIDSVDQLRPLEVIVSNSLPVWLSFNEVCPVFPSFLVPDNQPPPYAAIHIPPEATRPLQALPRLTNDSSHWQLVSDRVRVTFYGLRNAAVMDYMDAALLYMTDRDDVMGLMRAGAIRDEKQTQNEISALAQKKSWEVEVSYYQQATRAEARQLILSCIPTYIFSDVVQ